MANDRVKDKTRDANRDPARVLAIALMGNESYDCK